MQKEPTEEEEEGVRAYEWNAKLNEEKKKVDEKPNETMKQCHYTSYMGITLIEL